MLAAATAFATDAVAWTDNWLSFSRGWGYALAIEERCPDYQVRTDAVMGSSLSGQDYRQAEVGVLTFRDQFWERNPAMSCTDARAEAARLLGGTIDEVWVRSRE
jgi:hypothetical protein